MIYADTIARRQNQKAKTSFSAGLDEYGSKIEEKAKKENKEPQVFVDEIAKSYLKTWEYLGIIYSDFIRTTSQKHKTGVLEFVKNFKTTAIYMKENTPDCIASAAKILF